MMTQQEIFREVVSLPFKEQAELIEKIGRNLKQSIAENGNDNSDQKREFSKEERHAAIQRLRGIARVEGKPAPTDEEIKEDYTNHLLEKYK